jgi:hypothetical protein
MKATFRTTGVDDITVPIISSHTSKYINNNLHRHYMTDVGLKILDRDYLITILMQELDSVSLKYIFNVKPNILYDINIELSESCTLNWKKCSLIPTGDNDSLVYGDIIVLHFRCPGLGKPSATHKKKKINHIKETKGELCHK